MSQRNDQMDSHLAIATASIRVFANDGTLDQQELDSLLGLALRDGRIDAEEKRVLANIFSRASDSPLSPAVQQRLQEVRAKHGI
jgi:tellurite resistance protein